MSTHTRKVVKLCKTFAAERIAVCDSRLPACQLGARDAHFITDGYVKDASWASMHTIASKV